MQDQDRPRTLRAIKPIPQLTEKQLQRFIAKIERTSDCWLWRGVVLRNGYGQVSLNNSLYLAHRVAYSVLVGPIPEGLVIDHMCRNPCCVKPSHLQPVTHTKNVWRGERHRRLQDAR